MTDPLQVPDGSGRSGLPVRGMTYVLLGLSVLALIAIVAEVLWLKPRHDEGEQRARDRASVIGVSQQFMVQWNSFSSTELDDYKARVAPLLSTKFRSEFEGEFEDVAKIVQAATMSSTGTVIKTGVASLDDDSAQVLAVADATATSDADTRERHFRWQIDLVKVGGRWLVDSWDAVQDPSAAAVTP